MPVHIEEMTSKVSVVDGELPLSEAQIARLVDLVAHHLEKKQKDKHSQHEATALRRSAAPPEPIGD